MCSWNLSFNSDNSFFSVVLSGMTVPGGFSLLCLPSVQPIVLKKSGKSVLPLSLTKPSMCHERLAQLGGVWERHPNWSRCWLQPRFFLRLSQSGPNAGNRKRVHLQPAVWRRGGYWLPEVARSYFQISFKFLNVTVKMLQWAWNSFDVSGSWYCRN